MCRLAETIAPRPSRREAGGGGGRGGPGWGGWGGRRGGGGGGGEVMSAVAPGIRSRGRRWTAQALAEATHRLRLAWRTTTPRRTETEPARHHQPSPAASRGAVGQHLDQCARRQPEVLGASQKPGFFLLVSTSNRKPLPRRGRSFRNGSSVSKPTSDDGAGVGRRKIIATRRDYPSMDSPGRPRWRRLGRGGRAEVPRCTSPMTQQAGDRRLLDEAVIGLRPLPTKFSKYGRLEFTTGTSGGRPSVPGS